MERQIMFRAWDEENKKMYLPDFPFIGAGSGARDIAITLDGKVITPNSFGFDVQPEQPIGKLIIEQWTGLLDKHGTRIFEGDVIDYDGCNVTIWYDDPSAAWLFGTENWNMYLYKLQAHMYTVLGNIHTSPDLIK